MHAVHSYVLGGTGVVGGDASCIIGLRGLVVRVAWAGMHQPVRRLLRMQRFRPERGHSMDLASNTCVHRLGAAKAVLFSLWCSKTSIGRGTYKQHPPPQASWVSLRRVSEGAAAQLLVNFDSKAEVSRSSQQKHTDDGCYQQST
jgi:hypothetical protein